MICNELYRRIGPRQNWFTSRFLWRCFLWCSTDSCGQICFITFWMFVFISAYLSIKNRFFRTLLTFDIYIYHMHKRIYNELLPAHTKTPRYTARIIAYRYFELKYHFLTSQKNSDYFLTRVYITTEKYDKHALVGLSFPANTKIKTMYMKYWIWLFNWDEFIFGYYLSLGLLPLFL